MENKTVSIHRKRSEYLRNFMQSFGTSRMSECEILEFLLSLDCPTKEWSVVSKSMLDRFCSFAEILDADEYELRDFGGISESKALFLSAITDIYCEYQKSKNKNLRILTREDLFRLTLIQTSAISRDSFVLFAFDDSKNFISRIDAFVDAPIKITLTKSQIMQESLISGAKYIAFCFIASDVNLNTYREIIEYTLSLIETFNELGITFLDSIIVNKNRAISVIDKVKSFVDNGHQATDIERRLSCIRIPLLEVETSTSEDFDYFEIENRITIVDKKRKK